MFFSAKIIWSRNVNKRPSRLSGMKILSHEHGIKITPPNRDSPVNRDSPPPYEQPLNIITDIKKIEYLKVYFSRKKMLGNIKFLSPNNDFPDISKIYPDLSRHFTDFDNFWVVARLGWLPLNPLLMLKLGHVKRWIR